MMYVHDGSFSPSLTSYYIRDEYSIIKCIIIIIIIRYPLVWSAP